MNCTFVITNVYLLHLVSKEIARLAWKIALDSYRTFAPLKYPPHILALAYLHLATLLHSPTSTTEDLHIPYNTFVAKPSYVNAVMIDVLDLYIHHLAHTRVGPDYPLTKFINLQILVRRELGAEDDEEDGPVEIPPLRDASAGDRGTVRFILDWDRIVRENAILESMQRWYQREFRIMYFISTSTTRVNE